MNDLVLDSCGMRKEHIDEFAGNFALESSLFPAKSVENVVHRMGGRIDIVPYSQWFDNNNGSIEIRGVRDFTIFIPNFSPTSRDRFTIAHELGHYILHSHFGSRTGILKRSGIDERIEWEANWFAAGFLMPADLFKEQWNSMLANERSAKIRMIASFFMVSEQAAAYRADFLGCN